MDSTKFTLEDFQEKLNQFRKDRGWLHLDSADLAKSIVLESAELLEHFQWDNTDISRNKVLAEKDKKEIAAEVADVFIYLLEFCQENDIFILKAAFDKLEYVDKKYPAKQMKGGGLTAYKNAKIEHRSKNKI